MAALLLVLVGCGGGGSPHDSVGRGEVDGIVVDGDGGPVAGAIVSVGKRQTTSDSAGRYILTNVPADDVSVQARATIGGASYYGQNLGRVYSGETPPNVVVALYPEGQIVRLTGQVRDSEGDVLGNVVVGARPTNSGLRTSARAVTDRDGFYTLDGLAENVEYKVVASAQGYGDDSAVVTFISTADRVQDLVVKNLTNVAPEAPSGVFALALTTPGDFSSKAKGTAAGRAAAYEGVRRLRDPQRAGKKKATVKARDTASGSPIFIDLTWDDYPLDPTVRPSAFFVYRHETNQADVVTLLADPQASLFSDSDAGLAVGTSYDYQVVAASAGFRENSTVGRSAASNTASATPLDDLFFDTANTTGRTVAWTAVPGATSYTVYVYGDYPTLTSAPLANVTTSGTQITLDPTTVPSGRAYFVLVVGSRNASALTNTADTYTEIREIDL